MKKIKKAIRNWIIGRVARRYGYEIVNKWIYFCYNYPDGIDDWMHNAYGGHMGAHFQSKFSFLYDRYGARSVMPEFWLELSPEYRKILFDGFFRGKYVTNNNWER